MKANNNIFLFLIFFILKFGILYCNNYNNVIKEIKNLINDTISDDECSKNISNYYLKNNNDSEKYFQDFIQFSSISMNEIGSFINCIYTNDTKSKNKIHNNYYIFISNNKNNNINNSFIFGFCLLNICNATDYKNFFLKINNKLDDFFQMNNYIDNFDVFDLEKENENLQITKHIEKFILYSIPIIIILIQISFFLFPNITSCLFNCLYPIVVEEKIINDQFNLSLLDDYDNDNNNNNIINSNSDSQSNITNKKLFEISSCFSFIENLKNILNIQRDEQTLYNDIGLNDIKGIRSLSIICFIIGNVFTFLFQTPLIMKGYSYLNFLKESYLGLIIIFCVRHAPKIFLSCSGLCLSFKLLCYFDNLLAYEIENSDNENTTDDEINLSISNITNENRVRKLYKTKIFERTFLINKDPTKIRFSNLYNFLLIHLYKPFLFILICFSFKYSFQYFIYYFTNCGPLLVDLIKNILEYMKDYEFISHFFLIHDIIDLFTQNQNNNNNIQVNFMNIFWLPINEINFTILGSFIIFIGCNKKVSIDYYMLIFFFFIMLIKIIYVSYYYYYKQDNHTMYIKDCLFGYGLYNQIFNLNYYLIGIFFGLVNYTIQKEIKYLDLLYQKKKLLILPLQFKFYFFSLKFIKNNFFYIFIILLDIFLALFFGFGIYFNDSIMIFIIKLFSICDIELFLIILHLILLLSYLKGDNKLILFLSSNIWIIFNKLYFVFSCVCIPIIIFIIYQSETKIRLNYFNLFFYSLICGFMIYVISILVYIVFDLPYRRILKIYLQKKKEKMNKYKISRLS